MKACSVRSKDCGSIMLELRLFGTGQATYFEQPLVGFPHQQAYALLCFLLLHRGRAHPRERLAALFWGEHSESRARGCLKTALWRLRQVLEPDATRRSSYLLSTSAGEVGFNPDSEHWLDVAAFEDACDRILARPVESMGAADVETIEQAIGLYAGDLLEGMHADWALRERERLHSLHLNSLGRLMGYHTLHGAFEAGLACGRRILDRDPLREGIHRDMMRLYFDNGQRALAVRQYRLCCEVLESELGIPPMEETQALHAQIVGGAEPPTAPSNPAPGSGDRAGAMAQLRLAMQRFDEARVELERAMQIVEHYGGDARGGGEEGSDGSA
jgi:DNA-binding SARP family transcriptional activator